MTSFTRLAAVTVFGSLLLAGTVQAAPEAVSAPAAKAEASVEQMTPTERRYEALARILTLDAEQRPAWQAYVAARTQRAFPEVTDKGPAVDIQEHLERMAAHAQAAADKVKTLANARAELLKVLRPDQKYVFEMHESQHEMPGRSRFHQVHGYCN